MSKTVKINCFLCVLLAIIMSFNFFALPAKAEALTAAVAAVVLGLALGAIAELSAGLITEAVEAGSQALNDAVVTTRTAFHNLNQQHNSILVEYMHVDSDSRYDRISRVYPNLEKLTGVELELATKICDNINNSGNIENYLNYDPLSQTFVVDFVGYQELKKQVVNAWLAEVKEQSGNVLAETVGLPTYDLDFVGPIQGVTSLAGTKRVGVTKDGFTYSIPFNFAFNGYYSITQLEDSGLTPSMFTSEMKDNGYCLYGVSPKISCYGGALYVIFNKKIYYFTYFSSSETSYSRTFTLPSFTSMSGEHNTSSFKNYVASDGETLDKVASASDIPSFYCGYVYSSVYTGSSYPGESVEADPSEMIVETDGVDIDIPFTEGESALIGGLGFGLLNNSSLIELNEDGSIASADGITIDKLNQIIEALQNGTLEFEDIQSYLQTMSTLIANSNLTENQQLSVLKSLKDFAAEQNNDIAAINANIASISKALEMEAELDIDLDIDKPDIDASLFFVEHTGLTEAEALVQTSLPIVGQAKILLNNLFNQAQSFSSAPSFSFYWDSNNDGVTEKYTILDLSFLEHTLTNDNLEDKDRFTKPMTVREFIHQLFILISYVFFFVKIFKMIPGLIGGVESSPSKDPVDTLNTKVSKL